MLILKTKNFTSKKLKGIIDLTKNANRARCIILEKGKETKFHFIDNGFYWCSIRDVPNDTVETMMDCYKKARCVQDSNSIRHTTYDCLNKDFYNMLCELTDLTVKVQKVEIEILKKTLKNPLSKGNLDINMPLYCTSDLTISGDEESMKKLYNYIGKDISNSFRMALLQPIPSEIELINEDEATIEKSIDLNDKIRIEEYLKEPELNQVGKDMLSKYGSYCSTDWCNNNWGCESDICQLGIITEEPTELRLYYLTEYSTNDIFIRNLSSKFKQLKFKLINKVGTVEFFQRSNIEKGVQNNMDLPLLYLYVCGNGTGKFVVRGEEPDPNEFKESYLIHVVGLEWVSALTTYHFSKDNVSNWNDIFEICMIKYGS